MTKRFINQTGGIGLGATPGPFDLRGDLRLYPLKIESPQSVQYFLDDYLNNMGFPYGTRFLFYSEYVFLVHTDFKLTAGGTNLGVENNHSLFFHIPVKVELMNTSIWAFVEVFAFNESLQSVFTNRDARGVNAMAGTLEIPQTKIARSRINTYTAVDHDIYLEDIKLYRNRKVALRLSTTVSDFVGQSAEAREDTLIEISTRSRGKKKRPGLHPLLDALRGYEYYSTFALKQIPSPTGPEHASYQSLLLRDSTFPYERPAPGKEKKKKYAKWKRRHRKVKIQYRPCDVRIFEYDSHPIGDVFGFSSAQLDFHNRRTFTIPVDYVIILRKTRVYEERGKTLFYRSQNGDWSTTSNLANLASNLLPSHLAAHREGDSAQDSDRRRSGEDLVPSGLEGPG